MPEYSVVKKLTYKELMARWRQEIAIAEKRLAELEALPSSQGEKWRQSMINHYQTNLTLLKEAKPRKPR
jgi:hypothetical protein